MNASTKKTILTAAIFCTTLNILAQDITGHWQGKLNIQGISLGVIFHFEKTGNQYTGTLDSPDQGAFGIPIKEIKSENKAVYCNLEALGGKFEGKLIHADTITGTFSQAGQNLPLTLIKDESGLAQAPKRPQEPKPKFNYIIKDVKFENEKAKINLAGTLTLPKGKGPFPAVVLVSGSGPQDRNEEIFNHKPFWVIADYLTQNGIAVLRYDDRGVAESEGDFDSATSADFADDARAAVNFLRKQKGINLSKIGIIGHSEGGMIAPMVAADDSDLGFIVLLAGPGISIDKLLLLQSEAVAKSEGISSDEIQSTLELNEKIFTVLKTFSDEKIIQEHINKLIIDFAASLPENEQEAAIEQNKRMTKTLLTPWFRYFIAYEPTEILQKVLCPVLALNGDKDVQVTADENLQGIEESLRAAGNTHTRIEKLKNLNHLFQTSETGAVSEYAQLEETFSPEALKLIKDWILALE